MTLSSQIPKKWRVLFLVAIAVFSLIGIFMLQPISQPVSYHKFAGEQKLLGIANFWNVVSSIPFLFIGVTGLAYCVRSKNLRAPLSWGVLFAGVLLVAFGSSWYHLNPNNSTLIWDRLPMAVGFMGLFTGLLNDFVDRRAEKFLLFPLLALGVGAVVWWALYDDLRLYMWVQFFPLLCILLLPVLFTSPFRQTGYILVALGFYIVAKLLELADKEIYHLSDQTFAGHPFKHLVAAAGVYLIFLMLKNRKLA